MSAQTNRSAEISVGIFIICCVVALAVLAFKVSGLGAFGNTHGYEIKAVFTNVGDLKPRAPVRIAGVNVGEVDSIKLNRKTYNGIVTLTIHNDVSLPGGTTASIYTEGLLGSNYIGLTPGFEDKNPIKPGTTITDTNPAIILENLIGQFMFSLSNKSK